MKRKGWRARWQRWRCNRWDHRWGPPKMKGVAHVSQRRYEVKRCRRCGLVSVHDATERRYG